MIKRIFKFFASLSPLSREIFRVCICVLAASTLNLIIFLGVDLDGEFKEWASGPIIALTSTKLINFFFYYFTPFFIYTLAKAFLLNVMGEFKNLLMFMANQITGALYCFGLVSISLGYHMQRLSEPDYLRLYFGGAVIFFVGLVYFYLAQCAIQRNMLPKLWHNKAN